MKAWHNTTEAPRMVRAGKKLDHLKLVVVRVLHDGKALFEQRNYMPSFDGPWDVFVKENNIRIYAIAGCLLHAAREEAHV